MDSQKIQNSKIDGNYKVLAKTEQNAKLLTIVLWWAGRDSNPSLAGDIGILYLVRIISTVLIANRSTDEL